MLSYFDWQSENVFSSSSLLQTNLNVYITKLLPLSPGVENYQVTLVRRCFNRFYKSRNLVPRAFSLEGRAIILKRV